MVLLAATSMILLDGFHKFFRVKNFSSKDFVNKEIAAGGHTIGLISCPRFPNLYMVTFDGKNFKLKVEKRNVYVQYA